MEYKPELGNLINFDLLTNVSRQKLESIYLHPLGTKLRDGDNSDKNYQTDIVNNQIPIHPKLLRLVDNMIIAFEKDIVMQQCRIELSKLRQIFIDFEQKINENRQSKFLLKISNMHQTMCVKLQTDNGVIHINFLHNDFHQNIGYMTAIIHAINTFCVMYPVDYDNLVIYVSLDDFIRTTEHPDGLETPKEIIRYLKGESNAFNASGITERNKRIILVTKKEEIIKLLFHELIHYAGIDHVLRFRKVQVDWALTKSDLNPSEAFTEYLSVILTSAYNAIHLGSIKMISPKLLFTIILATEAQYSIYLSAAILKFFNYDQRTWHDFFRGKGNLVDVPIATFEYIFLRSQLMTEMNKIVDLLTEDLKIDNNPEEIIDLMKSTDNFLIQLGNYMVDRNYDPNISYVLIDLNWQEI